jgi:uncharacterized UPF0160 family protein
MASDDLAPKHFKKMTKIGTHSGTFHCDEVLACFMLKQLAEYKDAEIIRTRDENELAQCDIVVDVGGVYDPVTHRYDHHQRNFTETMNSLNAARRWTTKLSSAGLVYHHFGHRVLGELTGLAHDSRIIEKLFVKVYENFIEEVDGIDNGVDPYPEKPRYAITTNLSSRVHNLLPAWNQPEKTTDENLLKLFGRAVDYVGAEFVDKVQFYINVWWPARAVIEDAHSKRFEVDASGEIISLGAGGCPWKDHLLEMEEELKCEPLIKYVLFTDTKGLWRIQCVPASKNSFENRLSLPEPWRGLRDDELCKVTGIAGCTFVHASGFIGGNETFEGVLEMARKAVKS